MKKLCGVFSIMISFSAQGMEKKLIHCLTQEKNVSTTKFQTFSDINNEPLKFNFNEFTQEKTPCLELSQKTLHKEFVTKEPVSQGLLGYLRSMVPSLSSLPTWSTKQENEDWKNALVVKNEDFPGISHWFLAKNQYVPLQGPGIFVLFDAKTGKKIIDWRDSNSQQTPVDVYNVHMSHAAVLANNKAFIYNIRNGGQPIIVPFEKSARFVQHTTDNHFVTVNEDNLVVYDLIQNRNHTIELPSSITSYRWIQNATPYSLVIECKDGSVYFINPCDGYKLTKIEHENHFEILLLLVGGEPYFAARVDNEVRLYDSATGKLEYAGDIETGDIFAGPVYMSKDNRFFATTTVSCTRKGILLYNTKDSEPIFIDLVGDNRDAWLLLFSSDNTYVSYILEDDHDPENTVWRCHDTQNNTQVHETPILSESGRLGWLQKSPLFVYLMANKLFVYDANTRRSETLEFEAMKSRYMDDSVVVAIKGSDPRIGVFYTLKKDITPQNFITDEPFTLVGSAFNNDGTKFALATDNKFYVYDVASGRYLKSFDQQPGDKIQSFDFSKTDYFTALGTETVRVFNQHNFDLMHTLSFKKEGIKDGQFNTEKTIFVVRTQNALNFYYMHNGKLIKIK